MMLCQRCRRPIGFVTLKAGKAIPVDPDPTPDGRLIARLQRGQWVDGWFLDSTLPDAVRYVADVPPWTAFRPHSDTCGKGPVRREPPAEIMAKIRADIAAARDRTA
jgi:hypothetical protein